MTVGGIEKIRVLSPCRGTAAAAVTAAAMPAQVIVMTM